jgi:hypothetical protein
MDMTRYLFGIIVLAAAVSACDDKATTPTSPTDQPPKFTAILLPVFEVPPVTNADSGASGTAVITLNITRDAAGAITAATADFQMTVSGFPNGTTFTGAHIHTGATGVNGAVLINTGLSTADPALANGSGTISKNGIPLTPTALAAVSTMLSAPTGFYFNMHTPLNTGGAIRGQLQRTQ